MGTVEAVARENGAVIEALPAGGIAVFPADDAYANVWTAQAGARRCLRFALADEAEGAWPQAEIAARARWAGDAWLVEMTTPQGQSRLTLRVAGRHNVRNALAATAAALGAGIALADVVRGLEAFAPVKGRSQLKSLRRGGRAIPLVDDTYNANPDSVRAAIDVLAGLPAPRWLLLGDMGEVGDQGPAFHQEIGAYARHRRVLVRRRAVRPRRARLRPRRAPFRRHARAAGRARRLRGHGTGVRVGAGQGLAVHGHGTRGRAADRARRGRPRCCLAWPDGSRATTPRASASCACSSTTRSAR
jgi:hypothetical protein